MASVDENWQTSRDSDIAIVISVAREAIEPIHELPEMTALHDAHASPFPICGLVSRLKVINIEN